MSSPTFAIESAAAGENNVPKYSFFGFGVDTPVSCGSTMYLVDLHGWYGQRAFSADRDSSSSNPAV